MKQLLILATCLLSLLARGQNQNYVKTTKYKVATQTSLLSPQPNQGVQNITYFDGLGRPIQQISADQSATGKSIITPIEYDESGKRSKEYLPYPAQSSGLNFEPNALTEVLNYSEYQGRVPYSQKLYEKSPLGRVLKVAAPGMEWAMETGKEIKKGYGVNTTSDGVKFYKATSVLNLATGIYDVSFTSSTYTEGQLWKDIIKDENWISGFNNTSETYKDKNGRLVLKRNYENGEKHDTYHVYDQYGNLSYVFPPMASNPTSQLNDYCYQYKYDHRNRLVEKKMPGRQWEYIVYDKLDRPIATGPALSPFDGKTSGWLITKYDILGRIVYTGWYANAGTRKSIQDQANAFTNLWEQRQSAVLLDNISIAYTNVAFPTSSMKLLTVNYYDDYSFPNAPSSFPAVEGQTVYFNTTNLPKGMPTGKWNRLLEGTSSNLGELTYTLYDYNSRPIGIRTLNYLGGYTYVDSKFDFLGNATYTITRHRRKPSSQEVKITERFTYTDQNRLLKHTHQIGNAQEELLSYNVYDELGRLVTKKVGGNNTSGNTYLQKVDFSYNFRGWLTGINSIDRFATDDSGTDLFAMTLGYNDLSKSPDPVATTPIFNGNISYTTWISKSDSRKRGYIYQYDALNRLRNASYYKDERNSKSYDESMTYDKNGNITHLDRFGDLDYDSFAIQIDELDYTYKGNLLRSVSDKSRHPAGFTDGSNMADEYKYDGNGNMVLDENKEIKSVTYNHMNLPIEIVFGSGKINYLYNASGKKIRKTVTTTTTTIETEYLSGFQYISGKLDFFPTAEGYIKWLDDQFYGYVYNFKDQLGNIRMSYAMDPKEGKLIILTENHYYPYGLKHEKYNSDRYDYVKNAQGEEYPVGILPVEPAKRSTYQYRYNEKEWQDELGLNVTAMDFRQYDNALGRFYSMDLLAEKQYELTPYHYSGNNPVFFSDPTGLIQGGPLINAIWNNTAKGSNSFWQNDGSGLFYSVSSNSSSGFQAIDGIGTFYDNVIAPISLNYGTGNPPFNFFKLSLNDAFSNFFQKFVSENPELADNIFAVFAHGNIGGIYDSENQYWMWSAQEFDAHISNLKGGEAYKEAINSNKNFTLILLSCLGATPDNKGNGKSFAEKVALEHPNGTIIAADGWVRYSADGRSINGISNQNGSQNNLGFLVIYHNGKETRIPASSIFLHGN